MSDRITIFDTTLRDGEQAPGAGLTVAEKLEVARQLDPGEVVGAVLLGPFVVGAVAREREVVGATDEVGDGVRPDSPAAFC